MAKAGNGVIFIARGAMLEALRYDGLRVESTLGDFVLPKTQATDDPKRSQQIGAFKTRIDFGGVGPEFSREFLRRAN